MPYVMTEKQVQLLYALLLQMSTKTKSTYPNHVYCESLQAAQQDRCLCQIGIDQTWHEARLHFLLDWRWPTRCY